MSGIDWEGAEKALGRPIYRRVPVAGHFRLGEQTKRGPKSYGYFMFVPTSQFENIAEEFRQEYGDEPKQFNAVIPDLPNSVAVRRTEWGVMKNGTRYLRHACDGHFVTAMYVPGKGKVTNPRTKDGKRVVCPYYDKEEKKCSPELTLQLQLLDAEGRRPLGGVEAYVYLTTKSAFSISRLLGNFKARSEAGGNIYGVPIRFFLTEETHPVTVKGKRMNKKLFIINAAFLTNTSIDFSDTAPFVEPAEPEADMVVDPETGEILGDAAGESGVNGEAKEEQGAPPPPPMDAPPPEDSDFLF